MTDSNNSVLIGDVEKGQIHIAPYDSAWPVKYETHARIVTEALGDALLAIHHIGSASVPGLGAKPIVDILVVVADSSDEASYLPALEDAGYVLILPRFGGQVDYAASA